VGSHGFYNICQGDDSCFQKNFLILKLSSGIAGPVKPFMILVNDFSQGIICLHVFKNLITAAWVFFNQGKLGILKLRRPGQYLRRNRQLSDVVNGSRHSDTVYLLLG